MNKLWIHLTLAFGAVTTIALLIAAILSNYQVTTQFRRFVMHDQMSTFLEPVLVDYYANQGSWTGVETILNNRREPGGMGHGRGMRLGAPYFILADTQGQVIYAGVEANPPARLNAQEIAEAVPIEWQGKTIGYLLPGRSGSATLTGPDQVFLGQINRVLLQAGLLAAGLGLLMGVVVARGLAAPLGQLALAARRISQGKLDQQVPVKGADEIADLAHAFNEMTTHLKQAEILRRNLVADIAHELRTPFSVIQGNLQAILDGVYPLAKDEIATIYAETVMLSRLIDDLRELAQAEAGQLSLNIQPIALPPLVAETVSLFETLAQEQRLKLTATLPDHLPSLLADPHRVQQILHNLLANALQHTPSGGEVEVLVEQQAASIRISVTDTGPGISAEDLPHVFNRFWRADKSRSREQGGSGLGLAIAKQLIEAQGGQIGVESNHTPGQGSRFWFSLPIA